MAEQEIREAGSKMRLAGRMSQVAPSATLAVKQAAADLRAAGVDVVDFGPGEPDFPTPVHIVEAAKAALDRGETHYSAGAGLPELRRALAEHLDSRADVEISPEEILVTCGGKSALLYLMLALVDPGDEVIIPTPCWVSFPEQVRLAGGRPVFVPCPAREGHTLDMEHLAAAVTPRSKVIIVNSPGNPTGAVLPEKTWGELVDLAVSRNLMVVSDETYLGLTYGTGGEAFSGLALASHFQGRLVVVSSFSKTYSMTGWRLGYAFGTQKLIKAMTTLQSQDTTHPATFAQYGALAALEGSQAALATMKTAFTRRLDLVLEGVRSLPGFRCSRPQGAFYLFPDVREAIRRSGSGDDREFALKLLTEARVAVVAGSAFQGPGQIRLSFALKSERIQEGLRRMTEWLGPDAG